MNTIINANVLNRTIGLVLNDMAMLSNSFRRLATITVTLLTIPGGATALLPETDGREACDVVAPVLLDDFEPPFAELAFAEPFAEPLGCELSIP